MSTRKMIILASMLVMMGSAHATTGNDCERDPHKCAPAPQPSPAPAGDTTVKADAAAKAIADALATSNAELAAKIWSELNSSQRTEVMNKLNTSLTADQRNSFKAAISNGNDISIDNNSGGGNASAGGAQVSTTNIVKYGVAQIPAVVGLPSGVTTNGEIRTTITQCSLVRQKIVEVRNVDARGIGLFTDTTWKNGEVLTLAPSLGSDGKPLPPSYSGWEEEGLDEHGNMIIRRIGYGQQFQIDSYIVGTAMNSGLSIAGSNGSGGATAGLARGSNIATYGNFIVPHECQIIERRVGTRRSAGHSAGAQGAGAALADLDLQKSKALATTGKEVLVKKRNLCNGKPIPDGYECGFKRDTLDVVTDGKMKVQAAAAAKASEKK